MRKTAKMLFCVSLARPIKMRNMAKMLFCVRCEGDSGARLEARINNFLKITTRLPQLLISIGNVFGQKLVNTVGLCSRYLMVDFGRLQR